MEEPVNIRTLHVIQDAVEEGDIEEIHALRKTEGNQEKLKILFCTQHLNQEERKTLQGVCDEFCYIFFYKKGPSNVYSGRETRNKYMNQ